MKEMLVFPSLLLPLLLLPSLEFTSAPVATETPLVTKTLPDLPGKEGLVEAVVLAPVEVVPAHEHNADVFAYVLEGGIITQVKGSDLRRFALAKSSTNPPQISTSIVTIRARRNVQNFWSSL